MWHCGYEDIAAKKEWKKEENLEELLLGLRRKARGRSKSKLERIGFGGSCKKSKSRNKEFEVVKFLDESFVPI